ncbi:MAG: acetyl-CoA decarbonylase/synthase complex subunit alpha/beta, partial [Thermoleophilia bacterium]
ALFACEIIEACKYLIGPHPVDGIWLGAANDIIMRERGIEFVDGTAPGFAAITGAAPTSKIAVTIARELQEKNIYVFMAGSTGGLQFAEQLAQEGVQLGWETRLVPFGRDVSALIYALGFANRSALSFGKVTPGDYRANLKYNKDRVFAFVLAFGAVDAEKYAAAAGALNYGFPVIADTDIPQILPTGICTYEHVVSSVPYESMVDRALEVRGCKVKITKIPIPVPYGPAFEGERIRKQDMQVEFGGNITPAFEFVTMADMDEIEDGRIDIIGPDVDEVPPGTALPLAIWVEAAGRKMQTDFEAILERQIHHLVNGAEGIWHMGQRDIVWTRISQSGFAKGLRLRHYGEILHAKLLSNYPAIVDKVKVTIITEREEVEKRLAVARDVYVERNRRLASMTDESVDVFYSCLLCQSFAPNHVCVVTPERLGLCGAYNWLDARAAFEIDETGPNQPVKKGECLDSVKGVWKGVDEYVYLSSHKTIDSVCAYSIMDRPMTSCGCFEVICAYIPECNGIMAVNREYMGDTPAGMTFPTLAGNVGGGQQTPGFMGCGKVFLTSRKFLFAEGGHKRLIWMTRGLKQALGEDLKLRFAEQGVPDLLDQIPDESVAIDPHDIRDYLARINHPVLELGDITAFAKQERTEEKKIAAVAHLEKEAAAALTIAEPQTSPKEYTQDELARLKRELLAQIQEEIKHTRNKDISPELMEAVAEKFLGKKPQTEKVIGLPPEKAAIHPAAKDRLAAIKSFAVRREKCEQPITEIILGATMAQGGTRGHTCKIGGDTAMPFHLWEGEMPNRPLVAMEVFDKISGKFPEVLQAAWGELLYKPSQMAKVCVEKYGADLISIRLDGTHPEKGDGSPADALALVKSVLEAVDVPLIITGHSHFAKNNEVMKEIARHCAGENLLLNWVEQDNYRTIAGAALAYGHTLVAQSPIDVNIGKQLNILLTNMNISPDKIIMDPVTSAIGYGIEYTYSVMERIRLTALGGDKMLALPLIVAPGQECAKIKELRAAESEFPAWGQLKERAALWELSTATTLLYAGAAILIMYNPEAAVSLKKTIINLMDRK